MGTICSAICETEDLALTTPFGSCSCAKSACQCFKDVSRENSDEHKQRTMENIVQITVAAQLNKVEEMMKNAVNESIKNRGLIPMIHVLEKGMQSPPPSLRALTVRINQPLNIIEEEVKEEIIPVSMKLMELL